MSCNFLLYHIYYTDFSVEIFCLLSKVTISIVASSCVTEICCQHGPLEVQDFGAKLQPGYQLQCLLYIQCHPIIGTVYKGGTQRFRAES